MVSETQKGKTSTRESLTLNGEMLRRGLRPGVLVHWESKRMDANSTESGKQS